MSDIVKRLRASETRENSHGLANDYLVNPDGPEAADEIERLQEALVQHNDRLRSAHQIASRDGAQTNWKVFRGQCSYTLAEYHEIANKARAARAKAGCTAAISSGLRYDTGLDDGGYI
jgi:hypothetical protein